MVQLNFFITASATLQSECRFYKPAQSAVCPYQFRNEKGTGAEMFPEIVCGIVTGDAPVS